MLKFYSILIGENPTYTASFQPSSKRKIALYATCLMIPVIMWFINTFLLMRCVLESPLLYCLLASIVMGVIIFLVERAILMSSGSKMIVGFRIALGFVIALLGSISMDEVIFKSDIDNKVAEYKAMHLTDVESQVNKTFGSQVEEQQKVVNGKHQEWINSLEDAKGEADGTRGSGRANPGRITQLKLGVAALQEKDYQKENQKLESLIAKMAIEKATSKEIAEKNYNEKALLLRIKAMFDLIKNDGFMLFIYILFTLFLFFLEFLVVVIKVCSLKSIDEELEEARIILLRSKTQRIVDSSIKYFEPEVFEPRVQEAKLALQKNSRPFG